MIRAFSKAVGRDLPYEIAPRRKGDVLDLTAIPTRANEELGWKAEMTLEQACEDLWKWWAHVFQNPLASSSFCVNISNRVLYNPQGYRQNPPQKLLDAIAENRRAATAAA